MITQAVQDYLKAIYKIAAAGETVSTNAVADRLGVSQASVTGMIKKMAELKLIRHTPYYGVALTPSGQRIALEVIRHHRLLELYLAEALGFTWDQVHEEADKLEHVISEEFEDKMAAYLGNPKTDPHGAPIPSKDGFIAEHDGVPLSQIDSGRTVRVMQVSDRDPEMLRYLGRLGIYPDIVVDVVERAPFDGPILVAVGSNNHHLGQAVTDHILVRAER